MQSVKWGRWGGQDVGWGCLGSQLSPGLCLLPGLGTCLMPPPCQPTNATSLPGHLQPGEHRGDTSLTGGTGAPSSSFFLLLQQDLSQMSSSCSGCAAEEMLCQLCSSQH